MSDVAASVGIRAPSLYKRFKGRADLLHAAENRLWADLAELLGRSIIADDPAASVMAQAKAIRTFAKQNPNKYSLFFDIRSPASEAGRSARGKESESFWRGAIDSGSFFHFFSRLCADAYGRGRRKPRWYENP